MKLETQWEELLNDGWGEPHPENQGRANAQAKFNELLTIAKEMKKALEKTRDVLISEYGYRVYEVNFPQIDEAIKFSEKEGF